MPADWIVLRRLLTLLFKDRRLRMAFVLGLMEEGLGMTLGVASPLLLGRLIERLAAGGAGERIALVLAFAASWFAPSLLGAFKPVHTATIVAGLYHQLIGPILREQLPPLAIIHDRVAGGVTGALERLPFNLQLVLDGLVWQAAPVLLQVLLTLAAIAWTLPLRYAGLLGATLLAYLVLADRGAAHLVARSEASSQAVLSLSGDLGDVVANAERVVCNGALEQEIERLDAATERRDTANHRLATAIALATGSQTLLLLTGLSLVLVLAASDVATRRLGAADFVVLQAFALRLALPLSGWAISLRQAGGALADLRRTLALVGLLRPPAMVERPLAGAAADLVLEKVSFAYPGNRSGLSQISLRLDADQMVAIVGANGSGKSTLARLMAGLLTPDQGKVLVGGADLQNHSARVKTGASPLRSPVHRPVPPSLAGQRSLSSSPGRRGGPDRPLERMAVSFRRRLGFTRRRFRRTRRRPFGRAGPETRTRSPMRPHDPHPDPRREHLRPRRRQRSRDRQRASGTVLEPPAHPGDAQARSRSFG